MLSMDSFFVEAQSAHPVCGRKEGGKRAGGGASRASHRREGTESGEARNEKERRCVTKRAENRKGARRIEKARGESKKRTGESKNKESPNQSVGAEI